MTIIKVKTETPEQLVERTVEPIPVATYWQAVTKTKWLVWLLVLVAMATTFVVQSRQAMYRASVSVVLSASTMEVFNSQTAVEQILKSDNTLAWVADRAKMKNSPAQLRHRIEVEFVSGTNLLNINVIDPQAKRAKNIANLAAAKFVAQIKDSDTSYLNTRSQYTMIEKELRRLKKVSGRGGDNDGSLVDDIKRLDAEISEIKAELARIEDSGMDWTSKGLYRFLLSQRLLTLEDRKPSIIGQRMNILAQQQQLISQKLTVEAELMKVKGTRILAPAALPSIPSKPDLGKNVLLAGIAALIAGITLAIALNPNSEKD